MVIGHVDRQSPHIDDSARADALAIAFVDIAERVFPGGLANGCTTGVDFHHKGVAVRVVATGAPAAPATNSDPGDTTEGQRQNAPVEDNAVLSYGSDNAGGVHLCLGDARIHLSADAVHDLAAGLMAEATRPASPAPKEPR